jgi:hypothetical protein
MKLVYTKPHGKTIKAGDLVKLGDKILTTDGEPVKVDYFRPPHKPSSSGKVSVENAAGNKHEYFVNVIDAEWIEREDRN